MNGFLFARGAYEHNAQEADAVVLVKGIDIQDIVTLKKYDKKVKKFLTNKNGNDILIKLSARKADNA